MYVPFYEYDVQSPKINREGSSYRKKSESFKLGIVHSKFCFQNFVLHCAFFISGIYPFSSAFIPWLTYFDKGRKSSVTHKRRCNMCRKSQLNFLVHKPNEDSRISNIQRRSQTLANRNERIVKNGAKSKLHRIERILKNGAKSKLRLQNLWSADSNCFKLVSRKQPTTNQRSMEPAIHRTIEPAIHRTIEPAIHQTTEPPIRRTIEPRNL